MEAKDLKTWDDLNEAQKKFIQANARELFILTMLPPNDYPEDIVGSGCACCVDRKRFLETVLSLG